MITFDVVPEKLPFQVAHGSVKLSTVFQVAGFSVSGQVLDSVKVNKLRHANFRVANVCHDHIWRGNNLKTHIFGLTMSVSVQTFQVLFRRPSTQWIKGWLVKPVARYDSFCSWNSFQM